MYIITIKVRPIPGVSCDAGVVCCGVGREMLRGSVEMLLCSVPPGVLADQKALLVNVVVPRVTVSALSCASHPQVLTKMLSLAVERLETNRYMTADEKYRNVRVVPHLLW